MTNWLTNSMSIGIRKKAFISQLPVITKPHLKVVWLLTPTAAHSQWWLPVLCLHQVVKCSIVATTELDVGKGLCGIMIVGVRTGIWSRAFIVSVWV